MLASRLSRLTTTAWKPATLSEPSRTIKVPEAGLGLAPAPPPQNPPPLGGWLGGGCARLRKLHDNSPVNAPLLSEQVA